MILINLIFLDIIKRCNKIRKRKFNNKDKKLIIKLTK